MKGANSILILSFGDFNKELKDLTEEQCLKLLEIEKKNARRMTYLLRIFGRYNLLRAERERSALMACAVTTRKNGVAQYAQ